MNAKNGVKIVKRAERETAERQAGTASSQPESQPTNPTRSIARQVTAWVREFQQRQALEARRNLQILNPRTPALN